MRGGGRPWGRLGGIHSLEDRGPKSEWMGRVWMSINVNKRELGIDNHDRSSRSAAYKTRDE